ncbi:TRAP transporter small permease [Roseinatronobacter alkalisoli]|uniref:TRAP transporter small permease protein n=1 Tax=Roseinatronobacter alkalisoli TaxID=3028235 RepID=A0ABT5T8L2_9RHOB|nr:TRAP transporter small permease [Roseinatronobacter sp. HJB301]MDD7971045.1 TRAP transporter small permease [Roseinatronobacter sp. HJB301]
MKRHIDRFLEIIIVVIFAIIVASIVWQVFSRYVLQAPSTVTGEFARLLFMWLALIGGAYTFGRAKHLAIDIVPMLLPSRARQVMNVVILALVAGFAILVMIKGGWELTSRTLKSGQITPTLRLPMGYVYGAIPFSGLMIVYYCWHFLLRLWRDPDDVLVGRTEPQTEVQP